MFNNWRIHIKIWFPTYLYKLETGHTSSYSHLAATGCNKQGLLPLSDVARTFSVASTLSVSRPATPLLCLPCPASRWTSVRYTQCEHFKWMHNKSHVWEWESACGIFLPQRRTWWHRSSTRSRADPGFPDSLLHTTTPEAMLSWWGALGPLSRRTRVLPESGMTQPPCTCGGLSWGGISALVSVN